MAMHYWRPLRRDRNTPSGGTEVDSRTKVAAAGGPVANRRNTPFMQRVIRRVMPSRKG